MTDLKAQNFTFPSAATDPSFTAVGSTLTTTPYPTHLSCDGIEYHNQALTMKVFAWDGGDQGWTYDDNGAGPATPIPFLASSVYHPEIALVSLAVSSTDYLYAVIVYEDPAASAPGTYYEVYQWGGSSFTLVTTTPVKILSGSNGHVTINIAGDIYGHLIIVQDNGTLSNTNLLQLTAYIDAGSGTLVFGTAGTIIDNGTAMSQPDADITFDNYKGAPFDAMVYLSYIYHSGINISVSEIYFYDLFIGSTLNMNTYNTKLAQITTAPSNYLADHVSISVNDGYNAYLNSYYPHAGVAYRINNTSTPDETIKLFGVKHGSYASSSMVLNATPISRAYNRNPTVVAQPYEIHTVTAWDYDDRGQTGTYYLDGLAHTAAYTYSTNSYSSITNDMQVQTDQGVTGGTGARATTVTTASGYRADSLLYFYYDSANFNAGTGTGKRLEYKVREYPISSLRQSANTDESDVSIYPNPVFNSLHINATDNVSEATISDAMGRSIIRFSGNLIEIERALNKKLSNLDKGLYFLKLSGKEGITSVKFIKG